MKEKYIALMEKVLSAYTDNHIISYFNDVKENGLTEHGFPRLTANIGILIAHNRRKDLLPLFIEMMTFCCEEIPLKKAANDFSVREIICCLKEIEECNVVKKEITDGWRDNLKQIVPQNCYTVYAKEITDKVHNWALFTAVSEFFRQEAGLCDSTDFIELQLRQQLQWLDENGMYRDNGLEEKYQPIMYDLVSRGLFAVLLNSGYRGKSFDVIDKALKKAGLLTLSMQSITGEMAFGGRSNQFLHNEPWMIAVFEYEANRYSREGNLDLASRFKSAIIRAVSVTEEWLNKKPIFHIKNRFPLKTKYGCEEYAYFDKYMITAASNLYIAYLICDDSIPFVYREDSSPCAEITSDDFNKLCLKAGNYSLEFDTHADPHYDANGLGRVHKKEAPSSICLSCPCPPEPSYYIDVSPFAFSLCSAVKEKDVWILGADTKNSYEITDRNVIKNSAKAELICTFANGKKTRESYDIDETGIDVTVEGKGEIGFALPVFEYDGDTHTEIIASKNDVTVKYNGWLCRYETNGEIISLNKTAANRNGHYSVYIATGKNILNVKIEITKG